MDNNRNSQMSKRANIKNSIHFSSIASYLQVKIAEQMDFFDQAEFELSSKQGEYVVSLAKCTAFVDVPEIYMDRAGVRIQMKTQKGNKNVWRKTHHRDKLHHETFPILKIPRFRLSKLFINGVASFDLFLELYGNTQLVQSDLIVQISSSTPAFASVFLQVANMFNEIKECVMSYNSESDILTLPEFQRVEKINLSFRNVPPEVFLRLNPRTLILNVASNIIPIASLFLQQWARKERKNWFDWFEIHGSYYYTMNGIDCKTLFSDLSKFTEIRKFIARKQKFKKLLKFFPGQQDFEEERDEFFSIDRGDKKLLVFVRMVKCDILTREYTVIKGCPSVVFHP